MNKISAVILTKNSQRLLKEVLDALNVLDEVLILDSGSNDDTLKIASNYKNVTIYTHEFDGFGKMKQRAIALAKNSWILNIDSDEVASKELIDFILKEELDIQKGYSFVFKNIYNGKYIKCCGWYPDRHIRLFNREVMNFDDSFVHEKIVRYDKKEINEIKTNLTINHYSYTDAFSFLAKMQTYSTLFAEQNLGKKSSSPIKATFRALWTFIKNYFFQKGFLCGYEGFLISVYNAQTTFWKYIKLYELKKRY